MPPRWPRQPDRRDPDYRRLDDRMNFAIHVGIFAACNSGLWFFHNLQHTTWDWLTLVTGGWASVLAAHALYIFAIADYSEPSPESLATPAVGFQPKPQNKPKTKSKKTTKR
ncbi:MAG: 2TM domain-containing protein [Crinalium sp.]